MMPWVAAWLALVPAAIGAPYFWWHQRKMKPGRLDFEHHLTRATWGLWGVNATSALLLMVTAAHMASR